jgi:pimeloyl-ACP methyl ester carboxylesterase
MPFVTTIDGCEIYYETKGQGPAIAFVSGFMGITEIWERQIEYFSKKYQCIAFDNRGAGRSDKPFPRVAYGVETHAKDLNKILNKLDIDYVVIVGHSMGGNTALVYALNHPEKVKGIVFVGSYVSGKQIHSVGNTIEVIKNAVKTKEGRINFYKSVGLSEEIAMESTKWPLYAILGNAESFMQFDVGEKIKEVNVPTLILHGDSDIVSPLDPCGIGLKENLKDSELYVFENVNHCPMFEDPEKTNELIDEFLKKRVKWPEFV